MNNIRLSILGLLMTTFFTGYSQWKIPLTNLGSDDSHGVIQLDINKDFLSNTKRNVSAREVPERKLPKSVFAIQDLKVKDFKVTRMGEYGMPLWTEWPHQLEIRSKNDVTSVWKKLTQSYGTAFSNVTLKGNELPELSEEVHQSYTQTYLNIPIYDSEVKIHRLNDKTMINSVLYPVSEVEEINEVIAEDQLKEVLKDELGLQTYANKGEFSLTTGLQSSELQWYFNEDGDMTLAYVVDYLADLHHRYHLVVNAETGDILKKNNIVCHFHYHPDLKSGSEGNDIIRKPSSQQSIFLAESLVIDGKATGADLNGITYEFPIWVEGNNRYLMDASQPMFDAVKSDMPTSPKGAIITLDGQNKSYKDDDFGLFFFTSTTNSFNEPAAVSAHANAILSYLYFYETFGFNSIDNNKSNIISIVDVKDEDDLEMDNAFWNGSAIYYGNGKSEFHSPLARSLDVGAHELTHGVIQSTANLRYEGESGAINESFADIFAVMIDRDDYTLGEDVTSSAVFSTNALRDLANPNNGGSRLGDIGWQPKHVSEQYFGELDEGGVHINSGIPNNAFYRIAESIGKDKAEQIYFSVLASYLTPRSDFKDLRISVLAEAERRYGNTSTEYTACDNAFAAVGIVAESNPGQGNEGDLLAENPGGSFILTVNSDKTELWQGDLADGGLFEIEGVPAISSKPSVTDDGSFVVYVDNNHRIMALNIDWDNATVSGGLLESNPKTIWRNAVVSRDGSLLAVTTETPIDNKIYLLNLDNGQSKTIELSNPTTSSGFFTTDNVEYADAMEFDHSGEYLLYDAYNVISDLFSIQDAEYWDIGLMQVYDRASNQLIEGRIDKIFSNLDHDVSVGNPTFAKNHINVIAFDYLTTDNNENYIGTANIADGTAQLIYQGNTIMYPSYRKDDLFLFLDANPSNGSSGKEIRSFQVSENAMSQVGQDFLVVEQFQWAVPFANGSRSLVLTSNNKELGDGDSDFLLYPNPVGSRFTLESLQSGQGIQSVEIKDIQGRTVYQKNWKIAISEITIELGDIPSGIYAVQIIDDKDIQYFKKMVKP